LEHHFDKTANRERERGRTIRLSIYKQNVLKGVTAFKINCNVFFSERLTGREQCRVVVVVVVVVVRSNDALIMNKRNVDMHVERISNGRSVFPFSLQLLLLLLVLLLNLIDVTVPGLAITSSTNTLTAPN
jgi:hypothetical protein